VTVPAAVAAGLKRDHLHRYLKSGSPLDVHPPFRGLHSVHLEYFADRRSKRRPGEQHGLGIEAGNSPDQPAEIPAASTFPADSSFHRLLCL
jgi:hypothetical protein